MSAIVAPPADAGGTDLFGHKMPTGRCSGGCFAVGAFDHSQTIAAFVVLHLIHDVVNEKYTAAGGLEEICGIERVRDGVNIETLAFVLDRKTSLFHGDIGYYSDELSRIELI